MMDIFLTMNSAPAPSRKRLTGFVAYDKMVAFQQDLEFWKTPTCHHGPGTVAIFPVLSGDSGGAINDCDLLDTAYNKMWHLANMPGLVDIFQMTNTGCYNVTHK